MKIWIANFFINSDTDYYRAEIHVCANDYSEAKQLVAGWCYNNLECGEHVDQTTINLHELDTNTPRVIRVVRKRYSKQ